LPPIINDDDLVFKDESGREYDVVMRGERTPGKILFSAKCLAMVFPMPQLVKHIAMDDTSRYQSGLDYRWFRDIEQNGSVLVDTPDQNDPIERQNRHLYLTYSGLVHVIHASRTGIANQFRLWLEDIVFAAWFGTTEQRVRVSAKILNVCADQIAAIMGKCANNIACIYLIDIKRQSNGRRVYKYGRTNNVQRRFREHTKTYGADIQLVKFGFIPTSACVQAENDLKSFVKDFAYQGDEDLADKVELIQLNDEERDYTIARMLEIADAVGGNMRDQLTIYTDQLKDKDHQLELKDRDLELAESRHQAEQLRMRLELKDKDIECLKAEHRAEQAEHRAIQAESELKILRLQLELAQLKSN
jgi:hypothetical protein